MKILRLNGMLPLLARFSLCALTSLSLVGCSTIETIDTSTAEGAFQQAEGYEKDERFEEAIQKFAEVKNKHPYSKFATSAELRIADIHFKREAYVEAQSAYQIFKEFHPKHPQSDYVTFRLGLSFFNQLPETSDRDLSIADKAILYFDETIRTFPSSTFVAEAREKRTAALKMLAEKELYVADFYVKRKNCASALKRFEEVLKTYPNLGYDPRALYGATKCAFESGERERAIQHYKNLISLFSGSDEAKRAKDEFKGLGAN
jgi:outer membrane protein assembly factor BamD